MPTTSSKPPSGRRPPSDPHCHGALGFAPYADRMRTRTAAATAIIATVLLAGCSGGPLAPDPTPTVEPPKLVLPDDALLGLVAVATAPDGSMADVSVIAHAPLPYLVPEAADAVAATAEWCAGEVDEQLVTGRGFTFTAIELTVTPRDDSWPADARVVLLPAPSPEVGSTLATTGDVTQVESGDPMVFPDYVPHCRQPAVLDGPGSGLAYLGIPSDISGVEGLEPFTGWTRHPFGVTALLPDGESGEVTFAACAAAITPLGEELGAVLDSWQESFDSATCALVPQG